MTDTDSTDARRDADAGAMEIAQRAFGIIGKRRRNRAGNPWIPEFAVDNLEYLLECWQAARAAAPPAGDGALLERLAAAERMIDTLNRDDAILSDELQTYVERADAAEMRERGLREALEFVKHEMERVGYSPLPLDERVYAKACAALAATPPADSRVMACTCCGRPTYRLERRPPSAIGQVPVCDGCAATPPAASGGA